MTGPEIIPTTLAAVGKLADAVQKEHSSDGDAIREAAKASAELAEAGRIRAKRLVLREQMLLNLWKPLARFFGVSKDYFELQFPKELAQKLESVPEGELQTPKVSVVAPAMEALGYSLDDPSLKEMYLNLLAGASTQAKAPLIHPSFVETVRELSAEEAPVLDFTLRAWRLTAARIKRTRISDGGFNVLVPCLLDLYTTKPVRAPLRLPYLPS
ncbi:MAG: Abi-alpha family protein [Propionicimonas sp.]